MEQKNKKYPFPQANDFNKILLLLNIDNESLFNDKEYLKIYLDLGTERQISYYLSAFQFLGFIDDEKKFTSYALDIKNQSYDIKILMLCRTIISLPVFGEVFFEKYLFNVDFSTDQIAQLISIIYDIENYEVCKRRTSTVMRWLKWIEENKVNYNKLNE